MSAVDLTFVERVEVTNETEEPSLACPECGQVICSVEVGDTLGLLIRTVEGHRDDQCKVLFPEGSTIYVVDQQGATFAFTTPEEQAAFLLAEDKNGAVDLTAFRCAAPSPLTGDQAADYACSHGPDVTDE